MTLREFHDAALALHPKANVSAHGYTFEDGQSLSYSVWADGAESANGCKSPEQALTEFEAKLRAGKVTGTELEL